MGQRLVRAKSKIRQAGIPFRVPERAELRARLEAVLEAIYAAFAEGWSDPAGTERRRRNLAEEAIWLGRLVASAAAGRAGGARPAGADAPRRGAARARGATRAATTCRSPIRIRRCGTAQLIEEAEALLLRAERAWARSAASSWRRRCSRPMSFAGAPAAPTGRRSSGSTTRCSALTGSPVVAINRAIAMAETRGPRPASRRSTRWPTTRGSPNTSRIGRPAPPCWHAAGDVDAADQAYQRAIGLESDPGRPPLSAGAAP